MSYEDKVNEAIDALEALQDDDRCPEALYNMITRFTLYLYGEL